MCVCMYVYTGTSVNGERKELHEMVWCVYMYIFIYTYIHVYVHIHTHIYMHTNAPVDFCANSKLAFFCRFASDLKMTHMCENSCLYTRTLTHIYIYIYIYTYIYIYVICICTCIFALMCLCLYFGSSSYVYECTCIHTYAANKYIVISNQFKILFIL